MLGGRLEPDWLPAPVWVIGAMLSAQLGAALSVPLFTAVGPLGAAWLRVSWAALFLLVAARPRLSGLSAKSSASALLLGLATAVMTLCYFEAVARIPLGMATTIEFLGPLGVAVAGARRLEHLLWAVLAAIGVLLLAGRSMAEPADRIGIAFATAAAAGWASYILLMKRVGAVFPRLEGLAVSLLATACIAAPLGLGPVVRSRALWPVAASAGLALLVPFLTYVLEMLALRRMAARTFGVLMSLEPAIGALVGFLVLQQRLALPELAGIACIVGASLGAAWGDGRAPRSRTSK